MKKPAVRTPGVDKDSSAGESDPDAAIAAAAEGKARKIEKPRAPVAPTKVVGDPEYPQSAPVNGKPSISYERAMEMLNAETETKDLQDERSRLRADLEGLGEDPDEKERRSEVQKRMSEIRTRLNALATVPKLKRAVLTEQGWVAPRNPPPPTQARV